MQDTGKILCPICARELPQYTRECRHCGGDLHGIKPAHPKRQSNANPYEIVCDGLKFGIAFQGEVKIHGLELENAKKIVETLNIVDVG